MRARSAGLSFALVMLASAVAKDARASGYLVARFGGDHGTPASPNTFAVYFNPAAMGPTKGTQLSLDVAPILRQASYERTADALGNGALADPLNQTEDARRYRDANTGKSSLSNVLALGFLGLTTDLGMKSPLRLGWAVYVPFGGIAQWDQRTGPIATDPRAPGAVDGTQRWHNINGKLLSIYNTFAVSYTLEKARLSFGANVSVAFHEADTIRARNIPDNGDDLQGFDGRIVEGRTRLKAHGLNMGAALGVYWEPLEDRSLKLGLSYTSQPGFGEMRLHGELTAQAGSSPLEAQPTKVDLLQSYPDILRFGGAWRASKKWELRADTELVRWSVFDRQCVTAPGEACVTAADGSGDALKIVLNIPRNFKNAIGVRGGFGYFIEDDTELFASAAVSTSAVKPAYIDASVIDSTRIYASLGARHEFSSHFSLAGSANLIYFMPVDTRGQHRTDLLLNPSKGPSANGRYTSEILFLNVNATYAF